MHRANYIFLIVILLLGNLLFAQQESGKFYKIDRHESIYLPLGKISFADKSVLKLALLLPLRNTEIAHNVFTSQTTKTTKHQTFFL